MASLGHTSPARPGRITLETQAEWRQLDLGAFSEREATEKALGRFLPDDLDPDGRLSAPLAAMLARAAREVIFAAVRPPQERGDSLTSLTLALQDVAEPSSRHEASGDQREHGSVGAQLASEPEPVALPGGPAARSESTTVIGLSGPFGLVPVFCVEYAMFLPGRARVVVLTFTAIAPSDLDPLRRQFSEIASTLSVTDADEPTDVDPA
jgi:hypothetical protein